MRRLIRILSICLVPVLAPVLGAHSADVIQPASADVTTATPWIVQTDCDTLSVDPLELQVHFSVVNRGSFDWIDALQLRPVQDTYPGHDSCFALGGSAPSSWQGGTASGVAGWSTDAEQGVAPGETLGGFTLSFGSARCCYHVMYWDQPILEPFYWETVCFECLGPVPALRGTWGGLKSIYR